MLRRKKEKLFLPSALSRRWLPFRLPLYPAPFLPVRSSLHPQCEHPPQSSLKLHKEVSRLQVEMKEFRGQEKEEIIPSRSHFSKKKRKKNTVLWSAHFLLGHFWQSNFLWGMSAASYHRARARARETARKWIRNWQQVIFTNLFSFWQVWMLLCIDLSDVFCIITHIFNSVPFAPSPSAPTTLLPYA